MKKYNHKAIEKKWRARWKKEKAYLTKEKNGEKKFYILDMFPYPSGEGLHVGHPKGYIATDVYSRYMRMRGFNVLHPMGFDAFGLPAENYALKTKTNPASSVKKNIARYKKQLEILGFDYDWSREINTTDPEYYKWTQWIFLELFKAGLAYESNEPINWCPSCKTGLANEDVEDGKCERCGTVVEKKPIRQWVLRITDYAEKLLDGLDGLDWPESIKELQRNWIGKSNGSLIKFPIFSYFVNEIEVPRFTKVNRDNFQFPKNESISNEAKLGEVEVFTTRADTLFGATYLVLAPEVANEKFKNQNGKLQFKIENWEEVEAYIQKAQKRTEIERTAEGKEKIGVELKGIKAVNPANGEEIPVWVADYVLADYGTGAIMAVPAHDERDFDFAKKYNLPIREVISGGDISKTAYVGEGNLVNSGKFNGLSVSDGAKQITEFVGGKTVTKHKLRDWVFSRQRYWGEPLPLIFCENCRQQVESCKLKVSSEGERLNPGWFAVDEKDLPVKLPKVEYYEPTGTGESPLANIEKWVNVKCPKCGGKAKRETNTMPSWAGSSWYYLAYIMRGISSALGGSISKYKQTFDEWLPVDFYVGGAEHATRHLIYARFWHKFLYDKGLVPKPEPFAKLQHVGLIMGEDGRKMSKRWGNVINPDDIVERFGADSLRVYEMFMGPFDQPIAWNTDNLVGAKRFLERVWKLQFKVEKREEREITRTSLSNEEEWLFVALLHKTIKKVGEDISNFKFNTAVSQLMIFVNGAEKEEFISKEAFEKFVLLLAPFAPHISEELWKDIDSSNKSVHSVAWPDYDKELIESGSVSIGVQINGKIRASISVSAGESEEFVKEKVLILPEIKKWIGDLEVRKFVYVKNRIISIVCDK